MILRTHPDSIQLWTTQWFWWFWVSCGGSDFSAAFRTRKGQRYFSNDWNHFRKVLAPFQTQNRWKHFNCLTISYVRLNLSLPFVTAPITIHYKLHSGPSGGLIWVYLCPWYIYIYPTYKQDSSWGEFFFSLSFYFYLMYYSSGQLLPSS